MPNCTLVFLYNTVALSECNARTRHSHRFPWLRCSFISAWRHSPVKTRGISMSGTDISGIGVHLHNSLVYIWQWYTFTEKLKNESHFECFRNFLTQLFDLLRCNKEPSSDDNKLEVFVGIDSLCFPHSCCRLKKICPASFRETCQWLKFPLNGLRAQSRVKSSRRIANFSLWTGIFFWVHKFQWNVKWRR
jgi:hypothetical protein